MSSLNWPLAAPLTSSHRASFSGSGSAARTRRTFWRATSVTVRIISGAESVLMTINLFQRGAGPGDQPACALRHDTAVSRVLILLPTATYKAPDFLAAAQALGIEVVVGSEQAQTLATAMGDRALTLDLEDPEAAAGAVVEAAPRRPFDAVVAGR